MCGNEWKIKSADEWKIKCVCVCFLVYISEAADDSPCVDLCGRLIINKSIRFCFRGYSVSYTLVPLAYTHQRTTPIASI